MSAKLHFPQESVIIKYLEDNFANNQGNPDELEKKIISATAKFFANTDKRELGVGNGVTCVLADLKASIPVESLVTIDLNLTDVLIACAKKCLEIVEKKDGT